MKNFELVFVTGARFCIAVRDRSNLMFFTFFRVGGLVAARRAGLLHRPCRLSESNAGRGIYGKIR